MQVSIRTVGTAVLACLLSITTAVVTAVLVNTMKSNASDMTKASSVMADEFAEMFLSERSNNVKEQVGEHIMSPVQHLLKLGLSVFTVYNLNGSSLSDAVHTCRTMIALADQFNHPRFITQLSFVNLEVHNPHNSRDGFAIDMFVGPEVGDQWIVSIFNSKINKSRWYNDRVPFPTENDLLREEEGYQTSLYRHCDHFEEYERSWSRPWVVRGTLRISYAIPLVASVGSPWLVTEFSIEFLKPLLQNLAFAKGELSTILAYDDPNYIPKYDENVICLVEQDTGIVVECSHGFGSVPVGDGSWTRVIATESEHPIVGPVFQQLGDLKTINENFLFRITSSGTMRYPIPPQDYFIKSVSMAHRHGDEGEEGHKEGHDEVSMTTSTEDDHHDEVDETHHEDDEDENHREGEEEEHKDVNAGPPWVAVAIIPRAQLLATFDKQRDDVTKNEKRGTLIVLVIAGVIIVFSVIAVFVYETALISPLVLLMHDMHLVEQMRINDSNEYGQQETMFSEINGIRKSFIAMVDMLIEYKAFMPSYLLQDGDGEDSSEEEFKTSIRRSRCSSKGSAATQQFAEISPSRNLFALELSTQNCSFLTIAINFENSYSPSESYNKLLSFIISHTLRLHPHIIVSANYIQIVFNAPVRIMSYSDKGLICADSIINEEFGFISGVSYEISEVGAGNVGCQSQKWYVVRGSDALECKILAQYAAYRRHQFVVCSEKVTSTRNSGSSYLFAAYDMLLVDSSMFVVYRTVEKRKEDNQEWMYSLSCDEGGIYCKYNKGFLNYISGNYDVAKILFNECKVIDRDVTIIDQLLESIDSQTPYPGVVFPLPASLKGHTRNHLN